MICDVAKETVWFNPLKNEVRVAFATTFYWKLPFSEYWHWFDVGEFD